MTSPVAARPTLALAGPTAAGKTALAMAFAAQGARLGGKRLPVEIISVDSALVYRGMDIGTAKPSLAERSQVPHHLVDILDPSEGYSAARFIAEAKALIDDIHARGALPLLVGGTMMYFKALQDGLDTMPAANLAVRSAIDARAREHGWPALHAELARVDPPTAARLAPGDAQRIQRALEVWQVSGQPLSGWQQGAAARRESERLMLKLVALEPQDRSWLHARIAARFDGMLEQGLVGEVTALRSRSDLHADLPSMRCVGYRQIWQALQAGCSLAPGSSALQLVRDAGIAATRQLAKRQLTWLRSMPLRQQVACDAPNLVSRGLHAFEAALADS